MCCIHCPPLTAEEVEDEAFREAARALNHEHPESTRTRLGKRLAAAIYVNRPVVHVVSTVRVNPTIPHPDRPRGL